MMPLQLSYMDIFSKIFIKLSTKFNYFILTFVSNLHKVYLVIGLTNL